MEQTKIKSVTRKTSAVSKFAYDVRKTRISRGMTLATLASEVKSTPGYLSMLESGEIENPGMVMFVRLCERLKLKTKNYNS